jgi:hypothetical protein
MYTESTTIIQVIDWLLIFVELIKTWPFFCDSYHRNLLMLNCSLLITWIHCVQFDAKPETLPVGLNRWVHTRKHPSNWKKAKLVQLRERRPPRKLTIARLSKPREDHVCTMTEAACNHH